MTEVAKKIELIKRIDDESILLQAFKQEDDERIIEAILEKTKNAELANLIAEDFKLPENIRLDSLKKCSNDVLKARFEDIKEAEQIRISAICLFDGDYNWMKMLDNESSEAIKKIIIKNKIYSQSLLVQIAFREYNNEGLVKAALRKVSDEKYLLAAFDNNDYYNVLEKIFVKLKVRENIISAIDYIDVTKISSEFLFLILGKLVRFDLYDKITKILLKIEVAKVIDNYIGYIENKELLEIIKNEASSWYARALALNKIS